MVLKAIRGNITGYGDSVYECGGSRSGDREGSPRRQEKRSFITEQATSAKALR